MSGMEIERRRIIIDVESGAYEDALSISINATPLEINRAHLKALSRFRGRPGMREMINHAKSRIGCETPAQKGRRLTRLGRKSEALEFLTKELPQDVDDLLLVGQTLAQLWRHAEALEYFVLAVEKRGNAVDCFWTGATLEQLGRHDESLQLFHNAIKKRGAAEDYCSAGNLLLKMARLNEAKVYLERAIELGDDVTSPYLLQKCRARQKRNWISYKIGVVSGLLAVFRRRPMLWLSMLGAMVAGGLILAMICGVLKNF